MSSAGLSELLDANLIGIMYYTILATLIELASFARFRQFLSSWNMERRIAPTTRTELGAASGHVPGASSGRLIKG
jgi:hypothetical protein